MRTIRVKRENVNKAIKALVDAGFFAVESVCPNSERYIFRSYPGQDYEEDRKQEAKDVEGMTGIETSASGQQAHKIFKQVGMLDD